MKNEITTQGLNNQESVIGVPPNEWYINISNNQKHISIINPNNKKPRLYTGISTVKALGVLILRIITFNIKKVALKIFRLIDIPGRRK